VGTTPAASCHAQPRERRLCWFSTRSTKVKRAKNPKKEGAAPAVAVWGGLGTRSSTVGLGAYHCAYAHLSRCRRILQTICIDLCFVSIHDDLSGRVAEWHISAVDWSAGLRQYNLPHRCSSQRQFCCFRRT
jgi:hypothetical protein